MTSNTTPDGNGCLGFIGVAVVVLFLMMAALGGTFRKDRPVPIPTPAPSSSEFPMQKGIQP